MKSKFALFAMVSHMATMGLAEEKRDGPGQLTTSFEGPYLGIGIGKAVGDGMTDYPVLSGGTTYAPFDPGTGKALNIFGGYNFERGNLVYGADIQFVNLVGLSDFNEIEPENREVMDLADIRARLGYSFGNLMVYGAAGWSWARFRVHPGVLFGERRNQTILDGINLGLGVEYNINERWFASGEFTYRELNGKFEESTLETDLDVSTLIVRLAYRF